MILKKKFVSDEIGLWLHKFESFCRQYYSLQKKKKMKRHNSIQFIVIVSLILVFSNNEVHAQTAVDLPILKLEKKDRGLFGYARVDFVLVNYSGLVGWEGDCDDPGLSGCKPPSSLPDPVDETYSNELSDFAMIQIANGSRGGSDQVQVQVAGEPFMRVYNVTWSSTPVTARPNQTKGDGQTISIDVERTDI